MKQFSKILWLLFACITSCTLPEKEDTGKSGAAAYQDMHNGIFIHYMYVGKPYEWGSTVWADGSEVASLDELADNLDVNDLAEVAASARAQYVIFTTFHANMQTLFPSRVMNRYLPGHTSRRDAVGDLITALKAKNIRTVLYFHPSDAHDLSEEDRSRVGGNDTLPRLRWNDFINELMSEVLERYGKDLSGFFIDGGLPEYVDAARLRKTIKDYNPELWIIQNAGLNPLCADFAGLEDRMKHPFPATNWLRAQVISGEWWSGKKGNVVYNPEFAYRYTILQAAVTDRLGGGVAWSFGPYAGGRWEPGVRSFCKDLGALLDKAGKSLFDTRPGTAYITLGGKIADNSRYVTHSDGQGLLETPCVATESKDGKTTYLHVFFPPKGQTLKLPPPANGYKFKSARLFAGGRKVDLLQDTAGVTLTLPSGDRWDDLDTIIELE
ncbi:MAG: alpha-L-fucosidase [Tannerella sp.]|jgi:hypothetical protein|nr:alpha-L-fucosidase [Tannerella sp.]